MRFVDVDGAHSNSWSFWSYPRGGFLEQPGVPVYSTVRWAGIKRRYPFIREESPQDDPTGLLVTPTLDDGALRHLRAGGRVDRNRIGFQIVTSKPMRIQ